MIFTALLSALLGIVGFYLVLWTYERCRILMMMRHFPKPPNRNFILGDWLSLIQPNDQLIAFLRNMAKELYPHYCVRVLHITTVNILSAEDCEIFMSSKKHSSKSIVYEDLRNWLKDGLLISNGEKWSERRKILTQAFHFNILKDFVHVFNEETQKTVDIIAKKCSEPIEVTPLVTEYTLLSICETAMGHKLDVEDEQTKKYIEAVNEIGKLLRYRLMRPWLLMSNFLYSLTATYRKEKKLVELLHKFTRNVIKQRMKLFQNSNHSLNDDEGPDDDLFLGKKKRKRLAMLDVLLQAQKDNSIDFEGICEEVDTFMFEGHDTTANAINFCLMLIANHPQIQEKIVEEIESVMPDKSSKPTYEDLRKLDYMERCIKEGLRLYPSVHFISRIVDEDTTLTSGLVVPKGSVIHLMIFDVLRDPRVFPSPDRYDPDRFLPENIQNRHPFAYIPFSAGPRNCIGQRYALMEIKAFFVGILRKFKLTAVDTPETVKLSLDMVLRTTDGIKVKFTPRT